MTTILETVDRIAAAESWDQRVQEIRRVPERHGQAEHQAVYAQVAERLYKPRLSANFAFVPRREDYAPDHFEAIYRGVDAATERFTRCSPAELAAVLLEQPRSVLVFRTILGYTPRELSVATREIAARSGRRGVGDATLKNMEGGGRISAAGAEVLAATLDALISRSLWGQAPEGLRSKMDKSDTVDGWRSVHAYAAGGVPYSAFLLQRHFVVFDRQEVLRAILECEGLRLGGVPVFALLDGLGWERVNDALGPVVRDCDGRVFTLANLSDLLAVQPFPDLLAGRG